MNYLLSEEEFDRIDAVRGQLGLVASLMSTLTAANDNYSNADLYDFLATQVEALKTALDSSVKRSTIAQAAQPMTRWDWMHALKIAGGEGEKAPYGTATAITEKLRRAAQIDADDRHLLDAWLHALLMQPNRNMKAEVAVAGKFSKAASTQLLPNRHMKAEVAAAAKTSRKSASNQPAAAAPRKREKLVRSLEAA